MSLQILDYSDKDLFLLGDLHGEFRKLIYLLKEKETHKTVERKSIGKSIPLQYPDNCVMVICGDCGMGFNKLEYYRTELQKLQKIFERDNITLLMLRGNHDDPEYFKTVEGKFDFPNIKFIPDYSVLKTKDNISLCVGGAISYDRSWRLKENERLNKYRKTSKKSVYWEDEGVKENNEIIHELSENGIKINSIISHTIPFDFLSENYDFLTKNNEWFKVEPKVKKDIEKESIILKNLLKKLRENGSDVKWWSFGHTHEGALCFPGGHNDNLFLINLGSLKSLCVSKGDVGRGLSVGVATAKEINESIKKFNEESKLTVKLKVPSQYFTINTTINTTNFNFDDEELLMDDTEEDEEYPINDLVIPEDMDIDQVRDILGDLLRDHEEALNQRQNIVLDEQNQNIGGRVIPF